MIDKNLHVYCFVKAIPIFVVYITSLSRKVYLGPSKFLLLAITDLTVIGI